MPDHIMHPALSQLLPLEKIPNEVEALRDALSDIFDDIFIKNLIEGRSYDGSSGFYTLTLTTYKSLGINIPFTTDLKLSLNPTVEGTTEIPISFDYSWLILKYIRDFKTDSFDNAARSILEIIFDLANVTPGQLLLDVAYAFYPQTSGLQSFVVLISQTTSN